MRAVKEGATMMSRWASKNFPPYWAVAFSSYEEVTDFLRDVETECILRGQPSDGTVSFASLARCLHELGRPDREYRSIHVTGTNGKTTVSRMIAGLLRASGLRVGLYTSPHTGHFRERISVDGRPISDQDMVDACNHVKSFMDWKGIALSPFEFLTASAFFAFRAARIQYAVIEVGIGGRQDATNVIAPEVSVITNVDYDHMDLLGETIEDIAAEKAGIIKPVTPVICGTSAEPALSLMRAHAAALHAPLLGIGEEYDLVNFRRDGFTGICSLRVGHRVWSDVRLNSPAPFMAVNAAHALAAYDVLRRRGLVADMPEPNLRRLLAGMEFSPCCEVLPGSPDLLVDGAHNAPATAALAATLRTTLEGRRAVLVIAIPRDKPYGRMIRHLAQVGADRAIFTRYPQEAVVDPSVLARCWRKEAKTAAEVVEDPADAFRRAMEAAGSIGAVVATGSVAFAGFCRQMRMPVIAAHPGKQDALEFCRL
jgi:dihydrofolate synthase/folylpolyglutamate synthase